MDCPEFELLESILYEPSNENNEIYLHEHLLRLNNSATDLFDDKDYGLFKKYTKEEFAKRVRVKLNQYIDKKKLNKSIEPRIVELTVNKNGDIKITDHPYIPLLLEGLKIKLDTEPILSDDIFLNHKTTNRKVYDKARHRIGLDPIPTPGSDPIFDVLLFNKKNEITMCSFAYIAVEFIDKDGTSFWKTPPVECGLLKGVYRKMLLNNNKIIDEVITVEEIQQAQREGRKIKCFNSIYKEFIVELVL
ncbi:D-aminoacid aminotransferase-like PLP-dependent enzyme [Gigaspora margarita]|uniref:D-aminoacid aminotransferase-like PLP-dependent enzyme n=1 Tax=Gigaspora margarita TaxID=4874 RepID=A0A8H4AR90_GIGMA|nr:D-aminoacid aminotransferase-like PLP-dependent enzyme [Gigaspora margarita]